MDVTLMGGDVDLLFTNGAFAADMISGSSIPSVTYFSWFCFIGLATLRTFFISVTDGWNVFIATMKMVRVTVLTKEGSMTQTARRRG